MWFSQLFSTLSYNLIPFACVLAEGALCLLYLASSQGNKIPLQQIGALGCIIAYGFSVFALLRAIKKNPQHADINPWIPRLGMASCAILMAACINSFITNGMHSLLVYGCLLALGVVMYISTKKSSLEGK